jgi:hypothetical protein
LKLIPMPGIRQFKSTCLCSANTVR